MRPPVSMKPQELQVPEIRNAVSRLKNSKTKRSKQKAFTKLSKVVESYRKQQPALQTRIVESSSRNTIATISDAPRCVERWLRITAPVARRCC